MLVASATQEHSCLRLLGRITPARFRMVVRMRKFRMRYPTRRRRRIQRSRSMVMRHRDLGL